MTPIGTVNVVPECFLIPVFEVIKNKLQNNGGYVNGSSLVSFADYIERIEDLPIKRDLRDVAKSRTLALVSP